jgi:phosphoesterase RecJ-like protein
MADTENIIDTLRIVDGVEIACLLQPQTDGVRFSLRARSNRFPVLDVAHRLGGGGHDLAAGAEVKNIDLQEAERRLVALTGDTLAHD